MPLEIMRIYSPTSLLLKQLGNQESIVAQLLHLAAVSTAIQGCDQVHVMEDGWGRTRRAGNCHKTVFSALRRNQEIVYYDRSARAL